MLYPITGPFTSMVLALQDIQAVALMLCKMAFWLSYKVVVLHSDNSSAEAYLCNQGNIASLFLSRLACSI